MAKKNKKPKSIYKSLQQAAHETRYGIDSLHFSFHLSKKHGKKKAHVLSRMPEFHSWGNCLAFGAN